MYKNLFNNKNNYKKRVRSIRTWLDKQIRQNFIHSDKDLK